MGSVPPAAECLERLRDLHRRIFEAIRAAGTLAKDPVRADGPHDFAFSADAIAEAVIPEFGREWAREAGPIRVLTEESDRVFPEGAAPGDARLRLLVDPVDGTRVLLHDLRSAWTLSAVAPETGGKDPGLLDAIACLQSEIPTSNQSVAEVLHTTEGEGPVVERWNIAEGRRLDAAPLRVPALRDPSHRFVVFSKFFPEGKGLLAWIEESILARLDGAAEASRSYFFEDQYLSTGGQLRCLATGRYAFVGELRPLLFAILRRRERRVGIACRPYDIATLKIAVEAGVRVTDLAGGAFDPRMNLSEEIGFLAYATDEIRGVLEPAVAEILGMYRS